jgi:hypothetical protein
MLERLNREMRAEGRHDRPRQPLDDSGLPKPRRRARLKAKA